MEFSSSKVLILLHLLIVSVSTATSASTDGNFLQCISFHFSSDRPISQVVYYPNTTSYSSLLQSSIQNLRFLAPAEPKPLFIISPTMISHVQAAVICSKKHGLQLRVRSGGHDYEGLSYLANTPFVIIDLVNLRSVDVSLQNNTAWIQAGATLGEVYYRIAKKSALHGFPAGICPTVGVGGHFSGGGIGTMMRKYGTAADNIVDAYVVDANGRILDRKSMGEDLFWAIRGGGGASFGVILSWKINLVPVPPIVTVFAIEKTLEQGAMKILNRWQYIADKLHEDLFIRAIISPLVVEREGKRVRTNQVVFQSLFLGGVDALLPLMEERFPELGLQQKDCVEMSWIQSVLYFAGFPSGDGDSTEILLDRVLPNKNSFKGKSEFVTKPISEDGLEGISNRFFEEDGMYMIMEPFGGRISEISESEIAFPHRKGNLYNIQYVITWQGDGKKVSKSHIDWIRRLHKYLGPYVSKSPRSAYLNYRDLDLGKNKEGNVSYSKASVWGRKYFKNNFKKLALIKGRVDPTNFFRNEQSIPPLIV